MHENDEPVVPQELLAISRDMTSGGRHMDVAMSPWERTRGVGVSDDGTIWEFGMQNRDGVVYPRGKGKVAVSLEARLPRSFHRIDYGSTTFEASVLSDQTARLLDLRVRPAPLHPSATVVELTPSRSLSLLSTAYCSLICAARPRS